MKHKRGEQQLLMLSAAESSVERGVSRVFSKLITLWVPQRFVTPSGVDVVPFIEDVNKKIVSRGFVLYDGQLLTTPIKQAIEDDHVYFEDHALDEIPIRTWGPAQQNYFGLQRPYQMAEEGDYTYSHVQTRILDPYLLPGEFIVAIVHGRKDDYCFYCPCHCAEVVYTTRQRLVCMGCGAVHIVLAEPLLIEPQRLLTADEWTELFGDDGGRQDEELTLSVVDFQDIENVPTIWITDQWEDAKRRFVFFARSSPEVIEEAIRGTEMDPSIFLEAGFKPVDLSPPPAHQVLDDSVDVDLTGNAEHSLREGVASYLRSRKRPELLVSAIPQLFKAVELLLKARLQDLDSRALQDRPNNPEVLRRLIALGVPISSHETETVNKLRNLRNKLQHGSAKINHRTGLSLCRNTIVFLDRFAFAELKLWTGSVIPVGDWQRLLALPEVANTAQIVTDEALSRVRENPDATISRCTRCNQYALVRQHPKTGAQCIYCGHVPITKDRY